VSVPVTVPIGLGQVVVLLAVHVSPAGSVSFKTTLLAVPVPAALLLLTVIMCVLSAIAAIVKVLRIDPAVAFRQ